MAGSAKGERRGGRQPGTPNKRTEALKHAQAEAAAKVGQALGAAAFDGDAHAYLMTVYRDTRQPVELRIAAAKASLNFEKPRLAAVTLENINPAPVVVTMDPAEFEEIARRIVAEI